MWKTLWEKIKEVLQKMLPSKTIESTLHITPIVSNKMANAMELWEAMYKGEPPWLKEPNAQDPTRITTLGLPAFIASEKARMATLELKSEIKTPVKKVEKANPDYTPAEVDESGLPVLPKGARTIVVDEPISSPDRANYLNEVYQKKIINKIRPQLEYGIAKGGLVIKPFVVPKRTPNSKYDYEIEIEFVQADAFFPLAFSSSGEITEAVFVQTKEDKEFTYRRLEHHQLVDNAIIVKNRCFKAKNVNNISDNLSEVDLGKEIPLSEVPEWAGLQKEQRIENVDRLLFAYFKMPDANTIDTLSPLGVSGFSRAIGLIKDADFQYSRMLWEFEATEAAIDVDRDALMEVQNYDGTYHYVNPILQQRLFRPIDIDAQGGTYFPYNPPIRDISLINGLNNILMRIEDVCALSRGTLADVSEEARTATELKVLKQRTYQANTSVQTSLQHTLEDVVYIMNVYADLYEIAPEGEYEASFEWDDSMITDQDAELGKRLTLMQNGIASKLELRMWYFGETEAQAEAALQRVSEETKQQMEENIMNQMAMGEAVNQQENGDNAFNRANEME